MSINGSHMYCTLRFSLVALNGHLWSITIILCIHSHLLIGFGGFDANILIDAYILSYVYGNHMLTISKRKEKGKRQMSL